MPQCDTTPCFIYIPPSFKAISSSSYVYHPLYFLQMKGFWRVLIAKNEKEKKSKSRQISIFGFQCVVINIECGLKICISYMDHSQIWLNLCKDGCHLFLHLHMDDHHLSDIIQFLKETLMYI